MCAEYGDAGNTQFRHKRATRCDVFVSSIVTTLADRGSSFFAPPDRHGKRGDIDIGDAGTKSEAEGNSRQRCIGTRNGSGRHIGSGTASEAADSIRKARRTATSRKSGAAGGKTDGKNATDRKIWREAETESRGDRRQGKRDGRRKVATEETSKVIHYR